MSIMTKNKFAEFLHISVNNFYPNEEKSADSMLNRITDTEDAAMELADIATDNETRIAELEDAVMELASLIG